MTGLADVRTVSVPRGAVTTVHDHLRAVGKDGYEGLGLWVGVKQGTHFAVRGAFIPAQRHIRTADGVCVVLGADDLHQVNVQLFKNKLTLLAQIHSHPSRAYHSTTDDENAIATAVGCLSLVVPDFATAPFDLGRTAAYRLDGAGRWIALDRSDLSRLVTITD